MKYIVILLAMFITIPKYVTQQRDVQKQKRYNKRKNLT